MSEGARIGATPEGEKAPALDPVPHVFAPGVGTLTGLSVDHVLALQRTAGNAAVTRMLAGAAVAEPESAEDDEPPAESKAAPEEEEAEDEVEHDEAAGDEQPPPSAEP